MTLLRRRRPTQYVLLATAVACLLGGGIGAAEADDLTQTIDPNQAQGEGHVVLDNGHVDMGATLSTGAMTLEVHDDTQENSVWRQFSDIVVRVNDAGKNTAPDDPAYSFLGVDPGDPVWVIPQTEEAGVVWLGWNTQEPQLMKTISGGETFSLTGVEGPGNVFVFLQSGNFGAPDVLWDSTKPYPQDVWVEVNTHTHANWAFTQEGMYLMRFKVSAKTLAGEEISTEATLRVVVGSGTDAEAAFAAQWTGEATPSGDPTSASAVPSAGSTQGGTPTAHSDLTPIIIGGIAIVVVALLISAVAFVVSGRRTRARVWEANLQQEARPQDDASPQQGVKENPADV